MLSQLRLDLSRQPDFRRTAFRTGPSNEVAVAWIDGWPSWPSHGLAVVGPRGSGKSHLRMVWCRQSGARLITAKALESLEPPDLLGQTVHCAIEDVDEILKDSRDVHALQQGLLHLYNMVIERGGHILITGQAAPSRWPLALPDLRSRLLALPVVELGEPDDKLFAAVLRKLFADRQISVGDDVITYLLRHMERSFRALHGIVAVLDDRSLADQRQISVRLASEVITELTSSPGGGGENSGTGD